MYISEGLKKKYNQAKSLGRVDKSQRITRFQSDNMENKERNLFIDYLRILACFLVVLYHSRYEIYDWVSEGGSLSFVDHLSLNVSFVIGRLAVPLFFMITGYLTFPVHGGGAFQFLRKRLPRLCLPLIFWAVAYTLMFSAPTNYITDIITLKYSPQLWYLYALLGVTLTLPLISPFFENASRRETEFYLVIWLLTLIFNGNNFSFFQVIETTHNGMLFTNPISCLINFYGYVGYILLGFYVKKYSLPNHLPYILIVLGVVVYVVLRKLCGLPDSGSIAYLSCANMLLSVGFFLVACKLFHTHTQFLSKLTNLTFGVYLIHWLVFQFLYMLFPISRHINCVLMSLVVFLVSLLLVKILSFLPFKKYVIG